MCVTVEVGRWAGCARRVCRLRMVRPRAPRFRPSRGGGIEKVCILHHSPNCKASGDTCRLNQELLEFFAVIRVKYRDRGLCAMISESECGREKRRPCVLCHALTISRLQASSLIYALTDILSFILRNLRPTPTETRLKWWH